MLRLIHNSGTAATTGIKRQSHGQFRGNAALNAVAEGPALNGASRIFAPVFQEFSFAECRYMDVASAVSCLGDPIGEFAIARSVRSVVVNPLNAETLCVSMGDGPSLESGVVVNPPSADRNTATTIPLICIRLWVEATFLNSAPDGIQLSSVSRRFNFLNSAAGIVVALHGTKRLILGAVQSAAKQLAAILAGLVNYGHEAIVPVDGISGNSLLVPIFTGAQSSCESTTKSSPDLCAWVFSRSFYA